MDMSTVLLSLSVLAPGVLMALLALLSRCEAIATAVLWCAFQLLAGMATVLAGLSIAAGMSGLQLTVALRTSLLGLYMAVLVQLLGWVIGAFSARYLQGEAGQRRYVGALAGVLAAVHLLLLADHWVVLISAWALVGVALQQLLCFYPERAFACLAAHKKWIADRSADVLLVVAAGLAWIEVGSGSLSVLWAHVVREGLSTPLQFSAVALVLAVILRTALLPVHGWLIQVMEAPTPVSALLHAGVVNLGGFVLIRFAPLLDQALPARTLLLLFGLATAVLAGLVMLTRITIKVRLAWSTVAQMGFLLLECGLGLYTLAALHLMGHSLYKAHAFLSASTVVRQTRLQRMHQSALPTALSVALAPLATTALLVLLQVWVVETVWPWWWNAILGLAWAPLLWLAPAHVEAPRRSVQLLAGTLMLLVLSSAALLAHALPFGVQDAPQAVLGLVALLGLAVLYLSLALLQLRPQALTSWRRWSYAGFYLDEIYTRLALQLWPAHWGTASTSTAGRSSTVALGRGATP